MSVRSDVHLQLGINIRQLRERKMMSQVELGRQAGLHPAMLGGIERAERNPSVSTLKKVADGLDVKIARLFRAL